MTKAKKEVRRSRRNLGEAETRGDRNIAWITRYCRIPEGKNVGKPLKLTSKQKKWIKRIYDSPTRVFILSMGRKNGKSCFCACLLLLHLCGPEARYNSQLYSDAQSRDQAALIFGLAAKMVRLNPELHVVIAIRDSAKQLHCPELGTTYRALSADATTAFGLSPAFVIHDELGQVRGPRFELYEALETAAGAQEEPLSIIISTQAPNEDDLLSLLIDDAKSNSDPSVKLELYEAPIESDPFDIETIRLANPHFDELMNSMEVMRQANEAKRLPSREASYRNLVLNQRVEANNPFISRLVWDENGDQPQDGHGMEIWGGLDLSSTSDLTALVLLSENFDVLPTFWLPEYGLIEKSRADRVPYDLWHKQGYLKTTPGASIEYEWIAHQLREIFDNYVVKKIGFDRYNIKFLLPWLEKTGFSEEEMAKFVEFGQGFVSMSPALREMESLLLNKKLKHGKHPVLSMCAANARVVVNPAGDRKFVKGKSTGRIDGMVALAMAVAIRATDITDETSIYDNRDMITL